MELLGRAKSYEPGFSGLYLLEADIYHRQGEKVREIEAIKTALALDSLSDHPYYFLYWLKKSLNGLVMHRQKFIMLNICGKINDSVPGNGR